MYSIEDGDASKLRLVAPNDSSVNDHRATPRINDQTKNITYIVEYTSTSTRTNGTVGPGFTIGVNLCLVVCDRKACISIE